MTTIIGYKNAPESVKQFGKSAEERFFELLINHNYKNVRKSTNADDRLLLIVFFATHGFVKTVLQAYMT